MTYVKIALILLQLVQAFVKKAQRSAAMDEGARRQIAKATAGVLRSVGVKVDVEAETAKMTPEEILRDLEQNNELRD